MKNAKGSNMKRIINNFNNKLKDLDVVNIVIYIVFFALFALVGIFIIAVVTGISIICILQKESVLAVVILALPTVIVWIFDINNKNITNKSEKFNMYLKLQNSIEEKYNKLKGKFGENDTEENIQVIFNKVDMVEKFIDDLENLKKYTDIESSFYQIDLFYFFDKVNNFEKEEGNIDNKTIDEKIGKVKTRILKYILANTPEESLMDKLYLFTETGIFKNIDFRNLGDLSKLIFEGSPSFRFENCKIDLNNFSGFLADNVELSAVECRFYKGNIEVTSRINKKELQETYNIIVSKSDSATENTGIDGKQNKSNEESMNYMTKLNENKEESTDSTIEKVSINCEDSNIRFLDKRSNIALTTFNAEIYFSIEIDQKNYFNGKLVKNELNRQIKEKLAEKGMDNKDISIRYSKDYSDKPELDGKVKWQSWHSIDLPVHNLDIEKKKLKNDSIVIIQSGYAFVTEKDKEFHILFFTKEEFKELLKEKIEKNAYTVYKNAQLKDYVKFNFYFAELVK